MSKSELDELEKATAQLNAALTAAGIPVQRRSSVPPDHWSESEDMHKFAKGLKSELSRWRR